jgi:hypothetical protein
MPRLPARSVLLVQCLYAVAVLSMCAIRGVHCDRSSAQAVLALTDSAAPLLAPMGQDLADNRTLREVVSGNLNFSCPTCSYSVSQFCYPCKSKATLSFNVNYTSNSPSAVVNFWLTTVQAAALWLTSQASPPTWIDNRSCAAFGPVPFACAQPTAFSLGGAPYASAGAVYIIQNGDPTQQSDVLVFVDTVYNSALSVTGAQWTARHTICLVLGAIAALLLAAV